MKEAERVADEIIEKYEGLEGSCNCLEYMCVCFTVPDYKAHEMALIHVEGIIEVFNQEKEEMIIPLSDYDYKVFMNFWQEVKTIIENK